jgi:hypothetical protein
MHETHKPHTGELMHCGPSLLGNVLWIHEEIFSFLSYVLEFLVA